MSCIECTECTVTTHHSSEQDPEENSKKVAGDAEIAGTKDMAAEP